MSAAKTKVEHAEPNATTQDWIAVIFNPSFVYRFAHTVVAFYVTTGFVVLGVGAYLVRRGRFAEEGRVMLSMALWLLTLLVPLILIAMARVEEIAAVAFGRKPQRLIAKPAPTVPCVPPPFSQPCSSCSASAWASTSVVRATPSRPRILV